MTSSAPIDDDDDEEPTRIIDEQVCKQILTDSLIDEAVRPLREALRIVQERVDALEHPPPPSDSCAFDDALAFRNNVRRGRTLTTLAVFVALIVGALGALTLARYLG
jgi:hypothetical protein